MLRTSPKQGRRDSRATRRLGFERLEQRCVLSSLGEAPFTSSAGLPGEPDALGTTETASATEIVNRKVTGPGVQQMPSIAVDPLNPSHLVLAYMDYSLLSTGYAGIGVSVSNDGGDTWQETAIPLPGGFDEGAANPIVRFDDQGHVFVSFMAATFLGQKPPLTNPDFWNPERGASDREFGFQANNGVFVARSDDGGMVWNQPVAVVSHLYEGEDVFFELIPDIAIDTFEQLPDGQANPSYGNIYVSWTRLYPAGRFPGNPESTGGGDLMCAVSGDGGFTWETQLQEQDGLWITVIQDPINSGSRPPGEALVDQARLAVGPQGDVYLSAFGGGDFSVFHSTDGAASFVGPTHQEDRWLAFGPGFSSWVNFGGLPNNHFRTHSVRAIVADPTRPGQAFAAEAIFAAADPADIHFARTTDYGETWERTFTEGTQATSILNDDNDSQIATEPAPDQVIAGQVLPRMAVDAQGNIGVIWYDTRRDPADHLLDVFAAVSTDGGQTFSPNFRVSNVSFDADEGSFTNAAGDEEFYLGDFIGLAMANNTAYAVWTDTRLGNQDIYFARFPIDPAPAPLNDRFEPNETLADATELGRVVTRFLPKLAVPPGDADWYSVEAVATGDLVASALLAGGVTPQSDALRVELWDGTGTMRLTTGSDLLDAEGSVIGSEARFPGEAGQRFLVQVTRADADEGGAESMDYSLRLQSLTADLGTRAAIGVSGSLAAGGGALYQITAAAAGSIEVHLTGGDNVQGDLNLQVLDPDTLAVSASGQSPPGPLLTVPSAESNDSIGQANPTGLASPGSVTIDSFIGDGDFGDTTGDYDFFRFEAAANRRIRVDVDPLGSALDSMIALYDSAGNLLQGVDAGSTSDPESLTFVTEAADTYFVAVMAWATGFPMDPSTPGTGAGVGSTGSYTINIQAEAIGPRAVEQASLSVQQGQTILLLVSGDDGASGDFTLQITNLDQFTTPENKTLELPAGAGPASIAVADFNGDTHPDLAVPDTLSNTISVLLGNGDGTYQAPRQLTVGAYASENRGLFLQRMPNFGREVAVADLNGDMIPDLITTNYSSSDVSVLLGRGDGTFQPQRRFDATPAPHDLDAGDLNGDGALDLVVMDSTVGPEVTVAALLGRGDGTFQPQRTLKVSSGGGFPPSRVQIADFDEDGRADLAIVGRNEQGVLILRGNGDGTFNDGTVFGVETHGNSGLAIADIDGDANLDVAYVEFMADARENVFVLLGNGDGTFQSTMRLLSGQHPVAVAVADLGSQLEPSEGLTSLGPPDGYPDLVITDGGVNIGSVAVGLPRVLILPGIFDGEGAFVEFGAPQELAPAKAPMDLEVLDINGDGALDVAVVDRDGVLLIFGQPPTIVPNNTPDTARDLGTVVHLVDQTHTIVPGHEDAYFRLTVPTEAVGGAGEEIIDFSALFEATGGPGLEMELFDSAGNRLGAGERFRVRAGQGEELLLHVFGVEGSNGKRGSGAYTLAIDVLPQVVSVEAQSLLPGLGSVPGGPTTSLVIALQGDRLDAATAENPHNYAVTYLGPDGLLGTDDDRVIRIGEASIDKPIVYNPGANIEISTGLTYPTAVRQTVTLLFADPLPAGSYVIELSPAIQAAPLNETEHELLAVAAGFTGHPVASLDGDPINEGARIEAVDLVLQSSRLGDLGAFEIGTAFLTQLHDDLGALLDAILSEIGDDPSVTDSILDQMLARLGPSLGELGQRPTGMLAIFLDPLSFSLVDPRGHRATFDLQTDTLSSNIPNISVGVWWNVELVIVPVTFGHHQLTIADVPARARGGALVLGNMENEVFGLTSDIRAGVDSFTFNIGLPALLLLAQTPARTFDALDMPHWDAHLLDKVSYGSANIGLPASPLNGTGSGLSFDRDLRGGDRQPERRSLEDDFRKYDTDGDGLWTLDEFSGWWQMEDAEDIFERLDKDGDRRVNLDELKEARGETTDNAEAESSETTEKDKGNNQRQARSEAPPATPPASG